MSDVSAVQVVAARPRKVITAKGRGKAALNKVPDDILNNPELRLAMEVLPDNYNLEIPKVFGTCARELIKLVTLADDLEDTKRWLQESGSADARGTHHVCHND